MKTLTSKSERRQQRLDIIKSVVGEREPKEQTGQVEFMPSPEEIRRICELIQASWTDEERQSRSVWTGTHSYVEYPSLSESELIA